MLGGEVFVSGAKNAALPELCAALLTAQPVTLRNVPRLQDVSTMLRLIRNMGVPVEREDGEGAGGGTVRIDAAALTNSKTSFRPTWPASTSRWKGMGDTGTRPSSRRNSRGFARSSDISASIARWVRKCTPTRCTRCR